MTKSRGELPQGDFAPQTQSSVVLPLFMPDSFATNLDQVLDWSYLHRLSENDPEFELELLRLLVEDLQAQIGGLRAAVEQGDDSALRRIAHRIKGATANAGAFGLRALASQIEVALEGDRPVSIYGYINEMEADLAEIQTFLRAHPA